jgi:hypothetical protein
MEITPSIVLGNGQVERFPFNDFYKADDPQTVAQMRRLAEKMGEALRNDLEPGHASNATKSRRRRSPRAQQRTGAYFANQVEVKVASPVRKVPVFWITSDGINSLAYEASHGNMARVLQQFAGQDGI